MTKREKLIRLLYQEKDDEVYDMLYEEHGEIKEEMKNYRCSRNAFGYILEGTAKK